MKFVKTLRTLRTLPILGALVAPTAALAGPPGVPFSGTFTTQEVLGFNSRCVATGYVGGTTVGHGHASHLGAATGIASDCVVLGMTGPSTFSNGDLVLTAANGDQLHITYKGTLLPSATPSVSTLTGAFVIDGGTGRFSGATGSGSLSGLEIIPGGSGQLSLNGTIAY